MTNKTLGRGLSAFLATPQTDADDQIIKVAVNSVKPNPYQPRTFFDEEQLKRLVLSLPIVQSEMTDELVVEIVPRGTIP